MSHTGQLERSTRGVDYQKVPRPVAGLADDYPSGYVDPLHCHERSQLIYSTTGVMTVRTAEASFVLPPQRALWVPAGMMHEALCRGTVACRTLYIDQERVDGLPPTCRVVEVSDLLRELIVEATHVPIEYDESGRDGRLMTLLIDEIKRAETAPLHVPMPAHPRLLKVCQTILKDPADDDDLDAWAKAAGMGRRTFTRAFRKDTGMSFAEWRQNVRLMEAVSLLSIGESVTRVALDVGYNSPSAFTAMFRRTFGVAPSHYVQEYAGGS